MRRLFLLLLIYIFGEHKTSSGKQVMRGYKDLFCSSRRRKSEDLFFFFFSLHLISWTTKIAAPSNYWARFCSSNNSAREGLGLPTCGPSAEIIAHPCSKLMNSNGEVISNTLAIAEVFNEFFTNVGKTMATLLPSVGSNNSKNFVFSKNKASNYIFLSSCSPQEVYHVINQLKEKKYGAPFGKKLFVL